MQSILIRILQILVVLISKIENSYYFQLTLLHSNNINFCFEGHSDNTGGAARVLYYVKKFRTEAEEGSGPPVIYLNAGDNFLHTSYNTPNQWKIIADYLNVLKTDAMCLGNHELNAGVENLTLFLQRLHVPVVTANINFRYKHVLRKYIKPSRIIQIKEHKIGIVGVTNAREYIPFLPRSISLVDEIDSLQTECSRLYNSGVKVIIVLSHAGIEVDKLIAKAVDYVDVIVGCGKSYGKQLSRYIDAVKRKDGKYVPIIRDASRMTSLGVFKLEFDNEGDITKYAGRSMYLHGKIPQDVEALKLQRLPRQVTETINLGKAFVALSAVCQDRECNFCNLLADAMVDYKVPALTSSTGNISKWTDYPIALINAGAVWRTTPKDHVVTDYTLKDSMLYDDTIVIQKLTGEQLIKAILEGTEYYGFSSGYFMQFSGIRVQYNMTKLKFEDRLLNIFVRCSDCEIPSYTEINLTQEYNIIVNYKTYLNIDTLNQQLEKPEMDSTTLGKLTVRYLKNKEIFVEADDRLRVLAEASNFTILPPYLYYLIYTSLFILN